MFRGRIVLVSSCLAMAVALAEGSVFGQRYAHPTQSFQSSGAGGFVPKHEKLAQAYRQRALAATPIEREFRSAAGQHAEQQTQPVEPVDFAETDVSRDVMPDPAVYHDNVVQPASCDCSGGSTVVCGECSLCSCEQAITEHLSIIVGVQGFKGPANRGQGGSFGFHQGANWGLPLPYFDRYGWSGQIGFRTTQNDFSGATFSDSDRNQFFITTGAFRRADWGLQGGVVFDWLSDNWYYKANLAQLRGELSFALNPTNSVGFWFATNTSTDTQVSQLVNGPILESWETYDLYALMYRGRTSPYSPAETTILAGFTNESDGYISIQSDIALPCNWSLRPGFSYVAADERRGGGAHIEEAWHLGISLVWRPWARGCGSCASYDRPLFNVADNGSMIIHQPIGGGGVGGGGGGGDVGL